MKFHNHSLSQLIAYVLYYSFAQYLPNSYNGKFGKLSNRFRVYLCKFLFKKAGNIATINRRVNFGFGSAIEMGDGSGIVEHTTIPYNTCIGKNVMIGRYSFILSRNHVFERTDIPIQKQGNQQVKRTVIEDDVWIGLHCLFTPGRHIKKGTIIGMGSVVTKDFPPYSIIGGSPAQLIRLRENKTEQCLDVLFIN